jgi:hypothetical protein
MSPDDEEGSQRLLGAAAAAYAEWLNAAGYDPAQDQLDDTEIDIFRSAAGNDGEYVFHGLRAVVLHRLKDGTFDGMQSAIKLFQLVLECALADVGDFAPKCQVFIGGIDQFAPLLLGRIEERVPAKGPTWQSEPDAFDVAFRPLLPVIGGLRKAIAEPNWVDHDLALTLFRCIYDLYQGAVRNYYGYAE